MGYSLYRHISPSGKVYVGISKNKPEWRWNHGKGYCRGDQPLFERAILKYGWDNITHEIFSNNLSPDAAKALEIGLIKYYKLLGISYNITDGGDGYLGNKNHLGKKASKETREKMSLSHKGKLIGDKNPMFGRHETSSAFGKYGKSHPASKTVYQYDKNGGLIKKWECISDITRELGYKVTNITAVCKGKGFTIGGYRWSYSYPYIFNPIEDLKNKEKRKKISDAAKRRYAHKAKTNNSK